MHLSAAWIRFKTTWALYPGALPALGVIRYGDSRRMPMMITVIKISKVKPFDIYNPRLSTRMSALGFIGIQSRRRHQPRLIGAINLPWSFIFNVLSGVAPHCWAVAMVVAVVPSIALLIGKEFYRWGIRELRRNSASMSLL